MARAESLLIDTEMLIGKKLWNKLPNCRSPLKNAPRTHGIACNALDDGDTIKSLIANGVIDFVVSTLSRGAGW